MKSENKMSLEERANLRKSLTPFEKDWECESDDVWDSL